MAKKNDEFLELAHKRLKKCIDADTHNRQAAIEDLKFSIGIDQWDPADKQRRAQRGRPAIQVNLLPKYIKQVTGEMRQSRGRIDVKPVDSRADVHLARIRKGIIHNIEYLSNAESIYDYAGKMCVSSGYGSWRIGTRYCDEDPFVQEIYMEVIKNPFQVYLDPLAKDQFYADAEYGFILSKIPKEEFEDEWPDKEMPGENLETNIGLSQEIWYDKENVTVAEYFVRKKEKKKMCQMEGGEVLTEEEANETIKAWEEKKQALEIAQQQIMAMQQAMQQQQMQAQQQNPQQGQAPPQGMPQQQPRPQQPMPQRPKPPDELGEKPKIAKRRETEEWKIKQYKITASQILDGPNDFPGKFIPIVFMKGEETNIEGKPYVEGLIRQAKDPQRLFNYWTTSAAETVALAPKAPWVGTAKQFEGYENDYMSANVENFPYLLYNQDGNAPPPQRQHAADPPVAYFTQIAQAQENIKQSIGMYAHDIGEDTPERTGAAVTAKQKPGDTGTFIYPDNLRKAREHGGKIILWMIPEIYDSERDVRLRDVDDTETNVPINTTAGAALKMIKDDPQRFSQMDRKRLKESIKEKGQNAKFNDMSVGKYDLVVTSGPNFATERQETSEALQRMVAAYPDLMKVGADIIMANIDIKDADKLSKRLEKTLPMGLREQREGEPPPQPMPPPPQVQVLMEKVKTEQAKQQVQQLTLKLRMIEIYKETKETEVEMRKLILKTLAELTGDKHPADMLMAQGQQGEQTM
jgi:Phage P22-like portal protein